MPHTWHDPDTLIKYFTHVNGLCAEHVTCEQQTKSNIRIEQQPRKGLKWLPIARSGVLTLEKMIGLYHSCCSVSRAPEIGLPTSVATPITTKANPSRMLRSDQLNGNKSRAHTYPTSCTCLARAANMGGMSETTNVDVSPVQIMLN